MSTFAFTVITLYLAKIKEEARFENSINRTQRTIETRLDTYTAVMLGGAGLFVASDQVTAAEFREYVKQLEIEKRYPGIREFGYISLVSPANQEEILGQIQQLVPNFFFPARENSGTQTAITYVEPENSKNLQRLGKDLFTESIFQEAMIQARETRRPTLTARVELTSDSDDQKHAGFLLFIPLFRTNQGNTQSELVGYTYGAFLAEDLFGGIREDLPHSDIDFWIYDGVVPAPENILYKHSTEDDITLSKTLPQYTTSSPINIAGRNFTVLYVSNRNFNYSLERSTYPYYLAAGLVISFLVFALSRVHSRSVIETERAHAELLSSQEALRRSSIQYKTLAENASDLVTVIDPLGTILYASPSHEEMFGVTPDELIGTSILPYIHPEDFESFQSKLSTLSEGGHETAVYRVQRQSDGMYVSLEGVGTGLIDEDGQITGILMISRDITAREEMDRRKDEFISIASHELKTPVTSLKVYTQYLEQYFAHKNDRISVELLGKMDRQLFKLTRLIRDLLDVSRIESGRLDLHITSFDIKVVLAEVLETLSLLQGKHHIRLEKITNTIIEADRDRIAQILTNILANAIKYSAETQEIIVTQKKTKKSLTICVQDFGPGIPRSKQAQIFDRFVRVDGPKQETFAGFGLGLYIAREIVEKHHGKISVKSQVGKGSTFCFTIPLQSAVTIHLS